MLVEKILDRSGRVVPLIAALPYAIRVEAEGAMDLTGYDPMAQTTIYAGNRDYSTCREDDSAGGFLSSKSDTKKDD